jgi:hypothetical protein
MASFLVVGQFGFQQAGRYEPGRLRPEKYMTVTVGFPCEDGVVLGADSQESYEGSALKRSVPKLVWYRADSYWLLCDSRFSMAREKRAKPDKKGTRQPVE